MTRCVLPILIAVVVLAGFGVEALASCPTSSPLAPPCMEYWRADAVFVGVVTRVERIPTQTQLAIGPYMRTTAYLNVEEPFKGVERSAIVFEQDHCGYVFKEGERYFVYAYRNPNDHKLEVRVGNTRTRPFSEASDDLQFIRELPTSDPGARLFGRVIIPSLNIHDGTLEGEGFANIKITLDRDDEHREVMTDSKGNYEFKNLPVGTYTVRTEFPSWLTRGETKVIKVTGRACIRNEFVAYRNAHISGRVLDGKGHPIRAVPVSIVAADASAEEIFAEGKDKSLWVFTLTDEHGDYSFWDLVPGRYMVVINRAEYERSRGSVAARALPRLFYPGVNDLASAIAIVLDKQPEGQEVVFRLP